MAVTHDPEHAETRVIHDLLDFSGTDVLEVGCGDGRLTWRYADRPRSVLALDPDAAAIEQARASLPEQWRHTVTFQVADIASVEVPPAAFDVVVCSYSLCCMAPEGVVHALRCISAMLRPRGLLLNLLPNTTHRAVEVGVGGALLRLGHLDATRDIQGFSVTLAAQQAAIDARLFVLERETRFTFVDHFDTVESWVTDVAEQEPGVTIQASLVARARELLPPGTAGEVRISSECYAARLWRP